MNTSELNRIVDSTYNELRRLLNVKGAEYANSEDRLANFRRGAALTGCTPLQVLFIYMSKHYDAVASFVQTSAKGEARPSSEPIEGRLDDLINYCLLAKGLLAEAGALQDKTLPPAVRQQVATEREVHEKIAADILYKAFANPNHYTGVEQQRNILKGLGPEQC
jgi:hypothetical protein